MQPAVLVCKSLLRFLSGLSARNSWFPYLTGFNLQAYLTNFAEGDYNRADQDVQRDEQRVENIPGDVGQDVKDIPSDMGKMVEGAAQFIGDKIGGVQGDARRDENDVNQFDQGVDNSFQQGEQQGQGGN